MVVIKVLGFLLHLSSSRKKNAMFLEYVAAKNKKMFYLKNEMRLMD